MKIYLATWISDLDGGTLTKKKAKKRLTSFWFIQSQNITQPIFSEWCETGRIESKVKNK